MVRSCYLCSYVSFPKLGGPFFCGIFRHGPFSLQGTSFPLSFLSPEMDGIPSTRKESGFLSVPSTVFLDRA